MGEFVYFYAWRGNARGIEHPAMEESDSFVRAGGRCLFSLRAPWDDWNMWFKPGLDEFFEALIQTAVVEMECESG